MHSFYATLLGIGVSKVPQCVIIADDLTGANASGILLKRMNYSALTIFDSKRLEQNEIEQTNCIVCSTNSRSLDSLTAYNQVYDAAKTLKNNGVLLYSKRIDSTLRGNLGSETDALLDALNNQEVAMVVPCFPKANRVLVGGNLLVGTELLHRTEIAKDPKTPVTTSSAYEIFKAQSKYDIALLYIEDIILGEKHLTRRIKELKKEGYRIIIFDCISQEDIDTIVRAVIDSQIEFIAVDPGNFTATMARQLIIPNSNKKEAKILATIGSINAVTRVQWDYFSKKQKVLNVFVNTKELLEGEKRRSAEINRVVKKIILKSNDFPLFTVISDGIIPENRINLSKYSDLLNISIDDVSNIINNSLAEITYAVLYNNSTFEGLYTSGGDTTLAISGKNKASGILLLEEVIPLAVYGKFIKGDFDELKVITKGGMVGDKKAMNRCIEFLQGKLNCRI